MEFWFINTTGNKTLEQPSYMCAVLPLLLFFLPVFARNTTIAEAAFILWFLIRGWLDCWICFAGRLQRNQRMRWAKRLTRLHCHAWYWWMQMKAVLVVLPQTSWDGLQWPTVKPDNSARPIPPWRTTRNSHSFFGVLFGSSHLTVIMWHHCVTTGTLGTEICLAATFFVENLAGHAMLVVCVLHVTSLHSPLHYTISSWRQISTWNSRIWSFAVRLETTRQLVRVAWNLATSCFPNFETDTGNRSASE